MARRGKIFKRKDGRWRHESLSTAVTGNEVPFPIRKTYTEAKAKEEYYGINRLNPHHQ